MDFQQVFNQTHRTSNYIIKTNNYTQDTISIDMQIGLDIIYARNKERKKKKENQATQTTTTLHVTFRYRLFFPRTADRLIRISACEQLH